MADLKLGSVTYQDIDRLEFVDADTNQSVYFMESDPFIKAMQTFLTASAIGTGYYENQYMTALSGWGGEFCHAFKTVYLPNVVESAADGVKIPCENIIMPKLQTVTNQLFYGPQVKIVDLRDVTATSGTYSFGGNNLEKVILRGNTVPTLANTANQHANVTAYVPSAMLSAYQADSAWSTLVNSKGWTITALEGSAYENTDWFKE